MTDFDPLAKKDEIETELGKVGLHVNRSQILVPVAEDEEEAEDHLRQGAQRRSHVLIMECLIGDVAWTSRVQNATQHSVDEEFALLTREFTSNEFDEIRKELGGD